MARNAKKAKAKTEPVKGRKRHFINAAPQSTATVVGTRDAALVEMGRRLQHFMTEKGWNQSELERQAAIHMPDKKFGRYNISLYVAGRQMPGPIRLKALSKALGKQPMEIVPRNAALTVDEKAKSISFQTLEDGTVWIQVNKATDMETAMKVIALLERPQ